MIYVKASMQPRKDAGTHEGFACREFLEGSVGKASRIEHDWHGDFDVYWDDLTREDAIALASTLADSSTELTTLYIAVYRDDARGFLCLWDNVEGTAVRYWQGREDIVGNDDDDDDEAGALARELRRNGEERR